MKKVLYIVSTLDRRGPTNQLFYIIKNLNLNEFTPVILTLSPEPEHSQKSNFDKLGVEIKSLNLSRIEGMTKGPTKLKQVVAEIKPDIIHSQGLRADNLVTKYLKQYKCISTIRNYPFHDYPMKFGKLLGTYMAKKHLGIIKSMQMPIVCSETLATIFKDEHKIQLDVIQNGVDTERFKPWTQDEKLNFRDEFNIDRDDVVFISVGSVISRKDPLTVVEAFKTSSQGKNNWKLILVGDGQLIDDCKEKAKKDSRITFTGSISNVREYLIASDYFVSASLSEGLPNTVLEALAVGLPVILSDINPHKELLNFNEEAGVLFRVKDIEQLSQCFQDITNNKYQQMSKNAKNIIEQHLNANIMSNKYQKIYKQVMEGK